MLRTRRRSTPSLSGLRHKNGAEIVEREIAKLLRRTAGAGGGKRAYKRSPLGTRFLTDSGRSPVALAGPEPARSLQLSATIWAIDGPRKRFSLSPGRVRGEDVDNG
jgi:hypothetical protein